LIEIARNVLLKDWNTRFWYEGSKFRVESDNILYRKAKSVRELLIMINNVNRTP